MGLEFKFLKNDCYLCLIEFIIILTSNKNIMDRPYVVGIDIGGQSAKIGIVDTRGTVLSQTAIKSNLLKIYAQQWKNWLKKLIFQCLKFVV